MTTLALLLLLAAACLDGSVHAVAPASPMDLLAYPAYTVQLRPDHPIGNSSAERILASPPQQEENHSVQRVPANEDPLQAVTSKPAAKPFLLRSAGNGQPYLCSVPQYAQISESQPKSSSRTPLTNQEWVERRRQSEEDKRQAFDRGLALLEPLKGHCLYYTQGWFTCM